MSFAPLRHHPPEDGLPSSAGAVVLPGRCRTPMRTARSGGVGCATPCASRGPRTSSSSCGTTTSAARSSSRRWTPPGRPVSQLLNGLSCLSPGAWLNRPSLAGRQLLGRDQHLYAAPHGRLWLLTLSRPHQRLPADGFVCDLPETHAGSPAPAHPERRAYKASMNRPFATRAYRAVNMPWNSEYPFVRWLERNGYDVVYWSGVDTHRYGHMLSGAPPPEPGDTKGQGEQLPGAPAGAAGGASGGADGGGGASPAPSTLRSIPTG